MNTTTASAVKASVNESRFFETMAHLFKSSKSVVGELMQNARRAGATEVRFSVNIGDARMICSDDGAGIHDFSKLVHLCESGWDDPTKESDNPFGMGVFSYFYAADTVLIRSAGKRMEVRRAMLVNGDPIAVEVDACPITQGAIIEFHGLSQALTESDFLGGHVVETAIKEGARGFPIPVYLNGESLERPHAQEFLTGEITAVGFVSAPGVHFEGQYSAKSARLYLQGLPIETGRYFPLCGRCTVVHLDKSFVPTMPDRTHLFDSAAQFKRIDNALLGLIQTSLSFKRRDMSEENFVAAHWGDCRSFGMHELLDTATFVPRCCLKRVSTVTAEWSDVYDGVEDPRMVFSKDDIVSAWPLIASGLPQSSTDDSFSASLLKAMMDLNAVVPEVHGSHWLNKMAKDYAGYKLVAVEPENPSGRHEVQDGRYLVLADAVKLVFAADDNSETLEHVVTEGFVVAPEDLAAHGELSDVVSICYVMPTCNEDFATVFDTFVDSNDHYQEHWAGEAEKNWSDVLSAARGRELHEALQTHVNSTDMYLADAYSAGIVLAHTEFQWRHSAYVQQVKFSNLRDLDIWKRMAAHLKGVASAEQLRDAFAECAAPGAKVQPENLDCALAGGCGMYPLDGELVSHDRSIRIPYQPSGDNRWAGAQAAVGAWLIGRGSVSQEDWDVADLETKIELFRKFK